MWCKQRSRKLFLILSFVVIDAKDPELPLCPTNMQYFPQNLPMHCRLPGTVPPFPSPVYQNPSIGKQSLPLPVPLPGIPAPMPGTMPMPMVPMPPAPAHKLPVIVMPFYSPDTTGKKPHTSHQGRPRKRRLPRRHRRPKYYSSDDDIDTSTDTDSSTDTDDSSDTSSERGFWKGPRAGRRSNAHHKSKKSKHPQNQEILTPILQYVTKDGYVIYEKQISKGEAKDWLVSKSENKNAAEVHSAKIEDDVEYQARGPRDDKRGAKFSRKNVEENKEVKTELNPHQVNKKKNYKRKTMRKKDKE
ncbi:jg784 [Pararge aegeria aegeria]|uniref:Jg784 protein n=1 Tax=Pararge aegeria aegeria TaxID=348720 RepID=A0A8S4S4B7_9NEOP|nr:jg784 [Pararge aegeria aegeria]